MFSYILILAATTVLVYSKPMNNTCEKGVQCKKTLTMPLLDNMKASLKADLDVSEMNDHLEKYIQQEIQKGVDTAMKDLVKNTVISETSKAELRIQNHLEGVQKGVGAANLALLRNMIKSETVKFESRIQQQLQARQQYAFFATLSSDKENMKGNEIVVFDVVSLNVGGAYSGTTGKFTCKDEGLYTFSWTTLSRPKKDFTSILTVNGNVNVASNVVDNDETEDHLSGSSTVVVRLKSGDQVWLKVEIGDGKYLNYIWGPAPVSVFSGFKIN